MGVSLWVYPKLIYIWGTRFPNSQGVDTYAVSQSTLVLVIGANFG